MKRAAAVFLVVLLGSFIAGCGGGGSGGDADNDLSLLMQSTQALMEVSGYRMQGTIDMDMGDTTTGGEGQVISMDVRAEVQNADGEMRQHMFVTIGEYEVEAFIIGGVYYQNIPGQGWMKQSTGAYMSQNMGLGLVEAEQMEMMAEVAKGVKVVDESDEVVRLSFHLDEDFMQASLDLYRQMMEEGNEQITEEWLRMAEESMTDFQADMSMWIGKADDLIQRMEMSYAIGGMPEVGDIGSVMKMDFFDYNADIVVELPPEAAQAQEYDLTQ